MLFLLRKIRKTLLQDGELIAYFWYATGEILLVVIGILIALQLNSWNESRKELSLSQELISNYVDDLRGIADYLERRTQIMQDDLDYLNGIPERLNAAESSGEIVKTIVLSEYEPTYIAISQLNNETFDALVSNNQLRIIPDALSSLMVELNFRMADLSIAQDSVSGLYRDAVVEYSKNYPMPYQWNIFSQEEANKIWDSLDHDKKLLAFNSLVFTKKAGYMSILPRTDQLEILIKELILNIEDNYLNAD